MQGNRVMTKRPVSYFNFVFLLLATSVNAGNKALVLSGGINHHFSTVVTEQTVSKPGFIDVYSISLQYDLQISEMLGAGLRTMLHNFNAMKGKGVSDASIPVFLTLNYRLFEIGGWNQVQLAAGPVFHLKPSGYFENKKLPKPFQTGYGIGVFIGNGFEMTDFLALYFEGGLLYTKNSFNYSSHLPTINFRLRGRFGHVHR